jgi:hypothetical protein
VSTAEWPTHSVSSRHVQLVVDTPRPRAGRPPVRTSRTGLNTGRARLPGHAKSVSSAGVLAIERSTRRFSGHPQLRQQPHRPRVSPPQRSTRGLLRPLMRHRRAVEPPSRRASVDPSGVDTPTTRSRWSALSRRCHARVDPSGVDMEAGRRAVGGGSSRVAPRRADTRMAGWRVACCPLKGRHAGRAGWGMSWLSVVVFLFVVRSMVDAAWRGAAAFVRCLCRPLDGRFAMCLVVVVARVDQSTADGSPIDPAPLQSLNLMGSSRHFWGVDISARRMSFLGGSRVGC